MSKQPTAKRLKHLFTVSIRWKLLAVATVVGAVAAVIAIIGLNRIQTLHLNLTQTVDFLSTNAKLASLVKQELRTITSAEREIIHSESEDGAQRFADVVKNIGKSMDDHLAELRSLVGEEDRLQLNLFSEKWGKWQENHEKVRLYSAVGSDIEARNISLGEARAALDRLDASLQMIAQQYVQELDSTKQAKEFERSLAAAEKLNLIAAISKSAVDIHRTEKNLLLAATKTEAAPHEKIFEQQKTDLKRQIKQLSDTLQQDGMQAIADIQKAYQDYLDATMRIRTAIGEKSFSLAYHFVYDIGGPIAAECEAILDGLIQRNEQKMQEYRFASQKMYTSARNTLLGISILGIFISVMISFYTGYFIAQRLNILSRFAKQIQLTGDLSLPTPQLGGDEVGLLAEAFDRMRISLHEHSVSLSDKSERLADLSRTLEAKNREMEQFVYTVSHDLKSPLVSCKGLLGLLKEDVAEGDFDAVLESTERLDQATDQLNQIIDDLLMLSRIGRKKLVRNEVDVSLLLDELCDELAERIEESQARIDIEPDLPVVFADRSDVRRVFENLITNALKYGCHSSELNLTIGSSRNSHEVCYFVRDNGPGIDPKYHGKIFNLFQRLDTTQPGTGLGLASVEKIMAMHGGRVWVDSAVGEGATFWIAFPNTSRRTKT